MKPITPSPAQAAAPTVVGPPAEPPPSIDSRELLRGQRTVHIEHAGQRYTLRITNGNKLILTK